MMMNKQKTNKAAVLKYMLIVPLVLSLVLVANAQNVVKKAKKIVATTDQKSTKIVADSTKRLVKTTVKFTAPVIKKEQVIDPDGDKVYEVAEKMPEYPGGFNALMTYLSSNIKYPVAAQEAGTQGKVFVKFIVNKEGKVTDAKIIRGMAENATEKSKNLVVVGYGAQTQSQKPNVDYEKAGQAIDAEALRVVNTMPQWTPGEQNGQKVAVYFTLPIQFKLDGEHGGGVSKDYLNETIRITRKVANSDGGKPLYIVDGKEISEEDMKAIKPTDILEVSVLKNESATKLYGDKGKNGVVVITMKK